MKELRISPTMVANKVDRILGVAQKHVDLEKCAVNWGDLGVERSAFCIDQNGQAFYAIWIEEAAPDNATLYQYIIDALPDYGMPVEIIFEW